MSKHALVLILAMLAGAAPGVAGPGGKSAAATPATTGELLRELLRADAKNRAIRASGEVVALHGALFAADPQGPKATANAFIKKYGRLLGYEEDSSLDTDAGVFFERKSDSGTTLSTVAAKDKVPYLKANVVYTFDKSGALLAVMGRHHSAKGASMGSLAPLPAVFKAFSALFSDPRWKNQPITGAGKYREYLDDPSGGSHLFRVSQIDVVMGTPGKQARVRMDENGGNVVVEDGTAFDVKGRAFTTYPDFKPDKDDVVELPDIQPQANVLPIYSVTGPHFVSASSFVPPARTLIPFFADGPFDKDARHPNPRFLESHIYFHLSTMRAKAVGWGVTDAELDSHGPITFDPWTDSSAESDNGFYTASNHSIQFFSANPQHGDRHAAHDLSFLYHEYGHAVHRLLNPHFDATWVKDEDRESRAVAEGIADVFAFLMVVTPHWGWYYNGEGDSNRRDAENDPAKFNLPAVTPCWADEDVTYDAAKNPTMPSSIEHEIHSAGQVLSGACWDISQQVSTDPFAKQFVLALTKMPVPASFRWAGIALLHADLELSGGHYADSIVDVLVKRQIIERPISAKDLK